MEKENQVNATLEQFANIKENLAFMCKSEVKYKKAMHLITKILNAPQSVIHVNVNDIQNFLACQDTLTAFDEYVIASEENRMNHLVDKIKEKTKECEPITGILLYLFCPEEYPLLMEEINPLNEWLSDVDSETRTIWGMASTLASATPVVRAIVLVLTNQRSKDIGDALMCYAKKKHPERFKDENNEN